MKAIYYLIVTMSLYSPLSVLALSVDEKLPIRILRVSDTKKTVLVNRGLEDGLVLGDHAKFFLSVGVVARAVMVKASPSRSVWSIYRVVNARYIEPDRPMNIKIAQPVKLSEDNTRMLSPEDPYNDLTRVKISQGANDLPSALTTSDSLEIASLREERELPRDRDIIIEEDGPTYSEQDWEIWSMLHLNALSQSTRSEIDVRTRGKVTGIDFSLGVEKYWHTRGVWYSRVSIYPFLHYGHNEVESGAAISRVDVLEGGFGVNYHWNEHPTLARKWIWYTGANVAIGDVNQTYNFASSPLLSQNLDGSSVSLSGGVGFKYYLLSGWGFRALLDYYWRRERYSIAGLTDEQLGRQTVILRGPRFIVGLAYRW